MKKSFVSFLKQRLKTFNSWHPLLRGSISYAVMWSTGSLLQQTIDGKNIRTYDYHRMLKYTLYGSLYVAPTFYAWVRLSSAMWPQTNIRIGLIKAAIEQISYGPFATVSFLMGMSLLERRTLAEAFEETQLKFWSTYKVAICVWPILTTINFTLIPEHNRVIFVSVCSIFWTTFLAFIKHHDRHHHPIGNVLEEHKE